MPPARTIPLASFAPLAVLALLAAACTEDPALPPIAESAPARTPPTTSRDRADDPLPDAPRFAPDSAFLGAPDQPMRIALADGAIREIEKGHGGRSLAFKITLEDGTEGYYKPEQSFSAAHYYSELASYYLDRELGLGRVPPTIGRRLAWAPLRDAAAGDERIDEIAVGDDGTVRGAFIFWIPEPLVRLAPGTGWERWVRQSGGLAATPYQRPVDWAASRHADEGPPAGDPDTPDRAAELSDMILFDYLTTNVDRWGGDFTNVRTREQGGPLIYLDNGAGFTPGPEARIPLMDARLHALQRFRRSTVDAIRRLERASLERRMSEDPLAPILDERQWAQLEERRTHLLEHVAATEARFGERAWFEN